MNENPVILFDGICNFCNYWVNFIIKRDKKKQFRFASLQSEAAKKLLANYQYDNKAIDTVILIENGKVYTHSTAALRICKKLNGAWPLLYGLTLFPRFIRDWQYKFIAKRRYAWFGRSETCRIPSPEEKQLFLD
jgi:predicted DCC family thiol-disulfide oxidoreductase YuxK